MSRFRVGLAVLAAVVCMGVSVAPAGAMTQLNATIAADTYQSQVCGNTGWYCISWAWDVPSCSLVYAWPQWNCGGRDEERSASTGGYRFCFVDSSYTFAGARASGEKDC